MSTNFRPRPVITGLILAATIALAGCDSAEDRAEEFYQNAVALVEDGDNDRAIIELRNAIQLDETHIGARKLFAEIAIDQGQVTRGYRQLLAVAELDPDDLDARGQLARLAIVSQNWDEAVRHGQVLLAAETQGNEVVDLALRFRQAAVDRDEALLRDLAREAETLYETNREDEIIQRILIEGYVQSGDLDKATEVLRSAGEQRPDDRRIWDMQLAILSQQGDVEQIETLLREMLTRFPGDREIQGNLIRTLMASGRRDEAESFIRSMIDDSEEGLGAQVSLIALLRQTEGLEAALAETDAAIASRDPVPPQLVALRAGLLFDAGQRDDGIALMEELTEGEADVALVNSWKVALARMLQVNGNEVGARTRVEEVLASDPSMVEAIKMQAQWLIEGDDVDRAIATLRTALDQAPDDPEVLSLLSSAHARAGDSELAEEMLALSVEASNYAIDKSLSYARLLLGRESYRPAEDVLVNSLRRNGNNIALFNLLAEVYIREDDLARAEGVERSLRRLETDEAVRLADNIKIRILGRRDGQNAAIDYLEGLVAESGNDVSARIALIRARLAAGDNEDALRIAREFASEVEGVEGMLVVAAAELATGNLEAAETGFSEVVGEAPNNVRAWTQLLRVQNALGFEDKAAETLEAGLEANPGAPDLLWAKASIAEVSNDIDGAIEIYEALYEQLPNSVVVANNLGSLLATYRDDDESLERAYTVTRRLRGTDIAPFQDTYGWILYRRGELEEALGYLEASAGRLTNDPIVQYHLGRVLSDLGRTDEARAAFARAVEVAPEDDPRSQIAEARAFLEANPASE